MRPTRYSKRWGFPSGSMWTESFRPESLSDVIGQEHITDRLSYMVSQLHEKGDDGSVPHLMFAGRAGTGKTTTAIALMKDLFGTDWSSNFVELNASDERSINVIRTTVKDFSKRGVVGSYLVNGKEKPIPFNVVFLDECDNLTQDAQSALRRIMERYSKQTRFILSCNYPEKIIDPIRDRCAFSNTRFRPIDKKVVFGALKAIRGDQNLSITDKALKAISSSCDGSMRKALNILFTVTRTPDEATIEDVREVVSTISRSRIKEILGLAIQANGLDDSDPQFLKIHQHIDQQIETHASHGMSGVEILEAFFQLVDQDPNVPLKLRREIYRSIGEAMYQTAIAQDDLLVVRVFLRKVTV